VVPSIHHAHRFIEALDCPPEASIDAASVAAAIVLVEHCPTDVAESAESGHIEGDDQHHTYGIGP
jgi:hypothetical protein